MHSTPSSLIRVAALQFILAGTAAAGSGAQIDASPKDGVTISQVRRAQERITVGTIRDFDGNDILIQCKGRDDCVAVQGVRSVKVDVTFETDAQGNITRLGVDRATITGHYHKGPFAAGSEVRAWPLDASGAAFGAATTTLTSDDWGGYELATWTAGALLLEGHGRFYDEAKGTMSDASITLRAVLPDSAAPANVNAFTHIAAARALSLAGHGVALTDAVAQADAELARALGLEGTVPGGAMSLDGVDGDFLFELGTVLTAMARAEGATGGGGTQLQSLLDALAKDLADDGRLDTMNGSRLRRARQGLDLETARAAFEAHFTR